MGSRVRGRGCEEEDSMRRMGGRGCEEELWFFLPETQFSNDNL